MTVSSRAPLTVSGLLLLLVGAYFLAKPVMPLSEEEKAALHALHVSALTDTLHIQTLAKAGVDPRSPLRYDPQVRASESALLVTDSIEAERLIRLGKSKPPTSEVVNLQVLTIGQTCALIGAILLAAAWRPVVSPVASGAPGLLHEHST